MEPTAGVAVPWVLIILAVSTAQIAVALCIGLWMGRSSGRAAARKAQEQADHKKLDLATGQNLLAQLQALTKSVAESVGQHNTMVRENSDELSMLSQSKEPPLTGVVIGVVGRVIEANQRLQKQLAVAESKLEIQAAQLEEQISDARTDTLTHLPNRRAFESELQRRLAQWRRTNSTLSVMLVDVDNFKEFNDHYGHPVGDVILQTVAQTMRDSVREMDLVARYGGDEFAILLPSCTTADAISSAERIRLAIAKSRSRSATGELALSASFGVAEVRAGDDLSLLVARADEALYAAKHAGRNCTRAYFAQGEFQTPPVTESAAEARKPAPSAPVQDSWDAACKVLQDHVAELDELAASQASAAMKTLAKS